MAASVLDDIVKKAKGASGDEAFEPNREEGVALTKKFFKAFERRDAEAGYDLLCQIVASKGGESHAAKPADDEDDY